MIPKDDKIREAVSKILDKITVSVRYPIADIKDELLLLLDVTEKIVNTPEGWPEKYKIGEYEGRDEALYYEMMGYNKATDECNLARVKLEQKEVPTVRKIVEKIEGGIFRCDSYNSIAKAVQELIKSKKGIISND